MQKQTRRLENSKGEIYEQICMHSMSMIRQNMTMLLLKICRMIMYALSAVLVKTSLKRNKNFNGTSRRKSAAKIKKYARKTMILSK